MFFTNTKIQCFATSRAFRLEENGQRWQVAYSLCRHLNNRRAKEIAVFRVTAFHAVKWKGLLRVTSAFTHRSVYPSCDQPFW